MKRKSKSRPVEAAGYVHDVDKHTVQVRLRMVEHDGVVRTELVERALLRTKSGLNTYLDNQPVNANDRDVERLRSARKIDSAKPTLVASVPGWRPSGHAFAWPGRTIQEGKRTLGFQAEPGGLLETNAAARGDIDEWLKVVCPAVAKSSYGIFAQGVIYAAPLLPFSSAPEGALFSLTGGSGAGKSGICYAAQAIMGDPDPTLMPSWDLSLVGFRELISEVRHFALIIDDTSRDERTEKQRLDLTSMVGHQLGGGGRRRLAKAYEKAQGTAPVRSPSFGLTSSEVSPDELAALTGGAILGGARVRFIPVPVPPPTQGGVFDKVVEGLEGRKSILRTGRRAAKRLEKVIKRCHGVAFRPYIDHLTTLGPNLGKRVQSIVAGFVSEQEKRGKARSSSDLRIAEKFGLVGAGLQLAIEAGVASFTRKQARRAVQLCFDAAMNGQDAENKLLSRQIRRLRAVLQDPAQTPILATGPAEAAQAGFRRLENGRHVAYMKLDKLGPLLDLGVAGVERLLKELLRRKHIQPGIKDPYTRPVSFPRGRPINHLVFTPAMLKSAEDASMAVPAEAQRRAPMAVPMGRNILGDPIPMARLAPRGKRRARKSRWAGGRPR